MASVNSARALASFYDCLGNLKSTHKIDKLGDFKEYDGDIYAYCGVNDGIGQYRLIEKEIKMGVHRIIERLQGKIELLDSLEREQLDSICERFMETGYLSSKEQRCLSMLLEKIKDV